jgi:type VI secretion system protein ImpA
MPTGSIAEQIAAAIPGDNPAGVDTRTDSRRDGPYRVIKDAQVEARRIEKKAIEEGEGPSAALPQWNVVKDVGLEILTSQSKDLDVASYVIEAMVRIDGFSGLADGFLWTKVIVEKFWDKLYPLPDTEEGEEVTPEMIVDARIQPLSRLSDMELLHTPISWLEITDKVATGPYVFWHYDQAVEFEKLSDKEKEIREKRGTVTKSQFDAAVAESDISFFQRLLKGIQDCQTHYKGLIDLVSKKCKQSVTAGTPLPSYSKVQEDLDNCLKAVRFITKGRLPDLPDPTAAKPADAGAAAAKPQSAAAPVDKVLVTREDGFRQLLEVAAFFERTEPQSLIPALIKKVVRQGKLSPAEYFTELIEDEKIRLQIFKASGLDAKSKTADSK